MRRTKTQKLVRQAPNPKRIPIGLLPVFVRETRRVFIGCHKTGQRYNVDLCVYRRCRDRKKCPQFKLAMELIHNLGLQISPGARKKKDIEKTLAKEVEKNQVWSVKNMKKKRRGVPIQKRPRNRKRIAPSWKKATQGNMIQTKMNPQKRNRKRNRKRRRKLKNE